MGTGKGYLTLDGKVRWIPSNESFFKLWDSHKLIKRTIAKKYWGQLLKAKRVGKNLDKNGFLARAKGQAAVYYVADGQKRHIANPATMSHFRLSWKKIRTVSSGYLNKIRTGKQ